MSLPVHPHLLALRTAATLVLSALIAQAGWASAALGGQPRYWHTHRVGALVTVAICLLTAALYLWLRRSAGPVNVTLAAVLAVLVAVQYALGESGARAAHIFLGVLIAMTGTALTSWTFRHRLPSGVRG